MTGLLPSSDLPRMAVIDSLLLLSTFRDACTGADVEGDEAAVEGEHPCSLRSSLSRQIRSAVAGDVDVDGVMS
jgi:hypothetical protein